MKGQYTLGAKLFLGAIFGGNAAIFLAAFVWLIWEAM